MSRVVLLAEDDDAMRAVIRERLEDRGWQVVEVEDGYEMKDYLSLSRPGGDVREPDAVVSDLRMPGIDGLEALRVFQHRDRVVVITAFPDAETLERARMLGVRVVLSKPFRIEELLRELEQVLGH